MKSLVSIASKCQSHRPNAFDSNNRARPPAASIRSSRFGGVVALIGILCLVHTTGCYVPLRSPAIPANCLPDEFRTPIRSVAPRLNLATLALSAPNDYILGPKDSISVLIPELFSAKLDSGVILTEPITVTVMDDGTIRLPWINVVKVGGMNLSDAQKAIADAYDKNEFFDKKKSRISVTLAEKGAFDIVVMGEVTNPGTYPLPRFQNDVANAVALAGGTTEFSAEMVEVHREDDTAGSHAPHARSVASRGNATRPGISRSVAGR